MPLGCRMLPLAIGSARPMPSSYNTLSSKSDMTLFVGNVPDIYSPLAIHLVAQGLVDLKPLLTHTFRFGDALEAFEITKAGKDRDGKFVIKCVIDGPEDDFKI